MMPTTADDARAAMQTARYQLLDEDHDQLVTDWVEVHIGKDRSRAWGQPDTSLNTLSHISRQLSTPGLYGSRPDVRHLDAAAAPLIDPGGILDLAGLWTRMQRVQYLANGMGDFFLAPGLSRGRLVLRNVLPQNVVLWSEADAPSVVSGFWELRLRYLPTLDEWVYAWDAYDIGADREPSFRVLAGSPGGDGSYLDLTTLATRGPALVGDAYPYRIDGEPIIPRGHWRSVDSGKLWNDLEKRGAARGALNSILYKTYAGHCARDASGSTVFVGGLQPIGGTTPVGDGSGMLTVDLEPGTALYHDTILDQTPFVQEVGPGANLQDVANFSTAYAIEQMIHWGLNPADIQRQHANPSSGQALFLSSKQKREMAAMVEPLFRQSDLHMLGVIVAYMRAMQVLGAESLPATGYSITYAEIPESPDEERGRRDLDDWQAERGMLGKVELYQRWHPGSSHADAVSAYVQAARDNAEISEAINLSLGTEPVDADEKTGAAFNELTLATERLVGLGDLAGINQLRRAMATTLGVEYAGDLTELPGAATPAAPVAAPPQE